MVSLAHGTNDAQKTMGIITLTLITAGVLPRPGPPFWVILSAGLAIALGTYVGGWRIIRTMGKRLTEIQTPQGFAAETSGAAVILDLVAPRVRAVDHPGLHRRDLRCRRRPQAGLGALGRGRADGVAWAADPARRRRRRRVAAWLACTGTLGTIVVAVVVVGGGRASTPRPGAGRSPPTTSTTSRPRCRRRPPPERKSSMSIAWGSLLVVCVVSLAIGVAIVALAAFALVGISARVGVPAGGPDDGAPRR